MAKTPDQSATQTEHKSTSTRNRQGEKIGGGCFVFSRHADGRIHPLSRPFEHPTRKAAEAEAWRLAAKIPNREFQVLQVVARARTVVLGDDAPQDDPECRANPSRNAADPGAAPPPSQSRAGERGTE